MGLGRDYLNDPEPEVECRKQGGCEMKDCLRDRVWITKTGERIPVEDMTFEHLENTIHMLMKQEMALSLGHDYFDKAEQRIYIVRALLKMLRGEYKQRIIVREGELG